MKNDNDYDKDNELRIKEKLDFFLDEKIKVHIELLDKTFLNGLILKKLRENVYWIIDDKLGELFLFVKDIYDVDKYVNNEDKNDK